jgi:hypothetical protein
MRYSIMLQVVTLITLFLLAAAGLFAWLQNRNQQVRPSGREQWVSSVKENDTDFRGLRGNGIPDGRASTPLSPR